MRSSAITLFLTVGVVSVAGLVGKSDADCSCPQNSVTISTSSSPTTTAYSCDAQGSVQYPQYPYAPEIGASYDLQRGVLNAFAGDPFDTFFQQSVTVDASDSYTIMGPPAGTPIDFLAQLHIVVTGWAPPFCQGDYCVSCCGARALLREGTSNQLTFYLQVPTDTTIVLPIHKAAGEAFLLLFENYVISGFAHLSGYDQMSSTLTFAGLPENASISSCQGFNQNPPVSTLAATWGALKARYR